MWDGEAFGMWEVVDDTKPAEKKEIDFSQATDQQKKASKAYKQVVADQTKNALFAAFLTEVLAKTSENKEIMWYIFNIIEKDMNSWLFLLWYVFFPFLEKSKKSVMQALSVQEINVASNDDYKNYLISNCDGMKKLIEMYDKNMVSECIVTILKHFNVWWIWQKFDTAQSWDSSAYSDFVSTLKKEIDFVLYSNKNWDDKKDKKNH